MSQFFKALQQAERDRALREQRGREPDRPVERPRPIPMEIDEPPAPPAPTPISRAAVATEAAAPVERARVESDAPPRRGRARTLPRRAPALRPVDDEVTTDPHLVSLLQSAAFEAEQYRVLRHLVEQRRRTAQLAVIGVTSPGPGEGKTLTALNLAGALAQNPGARVLIVELDLREPSVDRRLGLPEAGEQGLTRAVLIRDLALHDLVRHHPQFNLGVLSAGYPSASPYELLSSPRLVELIDSARREFDYIVLDCPPVVPFPDCRVIGKLVDGFFVVVAADKTPRRLLEETLNVMDQDKVLGLVFNGDRGADARGYYYAHGRDARGAGLRRSARRMTAAVGRWRQGPAAVDERW